MKVFSVFALIVASIVITLGLSDAKTIDAPAVQKCEKNSETEFRCTSYCIGKGYQTSSCEVTDETYCQCVEPIGLQCTDELTKQCQYHCAVELGKEVGLGYKFECSRNLDHWCYCSDC